MDESLVTKTMSIIREITKYDPTKSTYTEKTAAAIKKYREKKKKENASAPVSSVPKRSSSKRTVYNSNSE